MQVYNVEIMSSSKLFSESEVAEIIRRAGELQEEKSSEGYVPGVAEAELRALAAEVGIQPEYLEQALREKVVSGSSPKLVPGDRVERVLPVDIPPDEFDMITESLNMIHGDRQGPRALPGPSQYGRTLQGQLGSGVENPHFKITSRGGRTKLEVWTDQRISKALTTVWISPILISPLLAIGMGPLVGIALAVAGIVGAIFTYRTLSLNARKLVQASADKIEQAISEYAESKLVGNPTTVVDQLSVSESIERRSS